MKVTAELRIGHSHELRRDHSVELRGCHSHELRGWHSYEPKLGQLNKLTGGHSRELKKVTLPN